MISIDFVPGSHGHFLEYVCNKYIMGQSIDFNPFNSIGASHAKFDNENYNKNKHFRALHYSIENIDRSDSVLRITVDHDDLLMLTAVTFLRAGDSNINLNDLQHNTYNTLANSKYFSWLVDSLNKSYPNLKMSADNPNCPRHILREFFKFGFTHPEQNGLILEYNKLSYPSDIKCFDFSYKSFYNKQLFYKNLDKIADWVGRTCSLDINDTIWDTFYSKQIFRNYKSHCNKIINCIANKESLAIPNLDLLQESYINGVLEKQYNIEMPFNQEKYFTNTTEIIKHLCLK